MAAQLWNTREVAAYLNVKESTIRNWVHIGFIPHVKFRGLVRYREEVINDWLAKRTVSGRTRRVPETSGDILRKGTDPAAP